jgi:hypothetical protein
MEEALEAMEPGLHRPEAEVEVVGAIVVMEVKEALLRPEILERVVQEDQEASYQASQVQGVVA